LSGRPLASGAHLSGPWVPLSGPFLGPSFQDWYACQLVGPALSGGVGPVIRAGCGTRPSSSGTRLLGPLYPPMGPILRLVGGT
jgi:hypothetical protein